MVGAEIATTRENLDQGRLQLQGSDTSSQQRSIQLVLHHQLQARGKDEDATSKGSRDAILLLIRVHCSIF